MATKYKADYFLKDFNTIRAEMIARLPIISDGKLTDLNESSISVTLVEVFAAVGDMLAFYLDSSALEAFLPTVRQPENVYRLTKLIGYKIREITSAKALVRFTLDAALTEEVFIPKGTRVGTSSGGGISYRGLFITQENTTIPIGDTISELVEVAQGTPASETFTGNGTASQYFSLSQGSIDLSTVTVKSGSTQWEQVDTFLFSQREDYVFKAETNYSGITRVTFGDGKFGRVPSVGEQLEVNYMISAGKHGNVGANAISLVLSTIYTVSSNNPVETITVTNPDPAAGGSDKQSLEQVKTNAPGALSALYRPLTKYDYTALIARLGGIQHVNVWGEQEEDPPSYENMNWANVCLVPTNGGLPSENLKYIVKDYLLTYQPITVRVRFIDPEYINVNVGMTVYVSPGYSQEEVRIKITDAVREFFDLENVRFGQDIYNSTFYKMVMSLDEVSHVYLDNLETYDVDSDTTTDEGQEIVLQKWQIPQLYTFSIELYEATELPIPDLYPDEDMDNEIWDFDG
jgi:hypothetical protein